MPVSIDTSASNSGATVSSLSCAITVASNRDRCLIVFVVSGSSSAITVSSVNWNTSEGLTQIFTVAGGSFGRISAYRLLNPTATAANVVVTLSGSAGHVYVSAHSLYGVDQTTPVGTARTTSATTGNDPWVGIDGGLAGGIAIGCGYRLTASAGTTIADVNGIPEYIAAGALSAATARTSRTPVAPAGATYGDLEIAHCSSENNATHSVSGSGWVKLGQNNSGASWTVSHYYRIHDGTNVDPTISWTGSVDASARRYLFRDTRAKATVAAPVAYHGTVGTGTASPHTSTGANTTEDDVLAIYIDICNANTAMAPETSWTERVDSGSATGPVRSYLADREMATSGSATGNISEAGGAAAWVQQQFEIYNADNGDQINMTERENVGSEACMSTSYETSDTYNTLGWNGTSGTTSQLIAGGFSVFPTKSLPVFNRAPHYLPRRAL